MRRSFVFRTWPFPEKYVPKDEKGPTCVNKSVCLNEVSLQILASWSFFKYFGGLRPRPFGPFVSMTKGRVPLSVHIFKITANNDAYD